MDRAIAELNNHRQSPRKVRLIAGLVRGKSVATALSLLTFAEKKAAAPIKKLIESAVANAKNGGMNVGGLVVKEITVDAGTTLNRRRPMSRGRAFPIRKRVSRIFVALSEIAPDSKEAKQAAKRTAKKAARTEAQKS